MTDQGTGTGTGTGTSTFVCTLTTFDERGRFDADAMRALLERIGAAGVGVYVGSSSPGEGYALSLEETEALYGLSAEVLGGRVPVRAMGVEPHTADQLLAYARIAEATGLEAMQLYCVDAGHANRPDEAELEAYFASILERIQIPAIVSSHVYSGYVIPLELLDRMLARHPNLVGVNCTNPDLSYVARLIDCVDGRAEVHVGGPMQALSAFALGAQGFLGTEGNVIPEVAAALIEHQQAGRTQELFAAYATLIRFFSLNRWAGGSMRFLKAALRVLGRPGWHLRPPFHALDEGALESVAEALRGLGVPTLADARWPREP